jgi:hypothetical protein
VKGNIDSINTLFELHGFKLPANFSDPFNMVNIVESNLKKEEDVTKICNPLDNVTFAKLLEKATKAALKDSVDVVLFNTVALGYITSHRLSKYAQTKQTKVKQHCFLLGERL